MNMPDEIWMHVAHGALSCHTRPIDASSVAFVPLLRAVKAEARVRQLTEAADRLLSLVQDKGQPLTHPTNQALINDGDTISVSEGNLWNMKWVLMAHSPSPAETLGEHDWKCPKCGRIHRNASNYDICGCAETK